MLRFAYRLAVRLGYINVRTMLHEISYREFLEWESFSALEPFDEERMDIRFASLESLLMNINRDTKKKPTPFKITDALLRFGDSELEKPKKQTWQEQKAIAKMMAQVYSTQAAKES